MRGEYVNCFRISHTEVRLRVPLVISNPVLPVVLTASLISDFSLTDSIPRDLLSSLRMANDPAEDRHIHCYPSCSCML